jgi:hypothetical protein
MQASMAVEYLQATAVGVEAFPNRRDKSPGCIYTPRSASMGYICRRWIEPTASGQVESEWEYAIVPANVLPLGISLER